MAINKLISIKVPIMDAMELCGTENAKDEMVFTRWGELAEKEIGSRFQFVKKIAVLDIENCAACLPNDAAYLQRALLGNYGCDCTDLFYKWCSAVSVETSTLSSSSVPPSFLVVDAESTGWTTFNNVVDCLIQNNKLMFFQNLDGQKVTVQYLAYETDCDGLYKVGQNHVRAITYYICWMYFMRKKHKSNDDFAMVNKYEAMWERECGNARATDNILTEGQRRDIANQLSDPLAGRGLATGMVNSLSDGWYWNY